MSTQNLTANGKIALAPTYQLTPAHRDDSGNVHVYVAGLNTWRLVNESAHLFRPDVTPAAAPAKDAPYTPPATWHPNRCYCGRFGGGHIPGLRAPIRGDKSCEGDQIRPHDPETCGACLAGATDGPPPASARRGDTGYGTFAVISAQYQRNGGGGIGFFTGLVRGLDGEYAGRVLQVTTLLSRDGEATQYDQIPVFVTDPTDPTNPGNKFRGDVFVDVAWAVVDTVDDQWNARMAELAARNANR